MGSCAVDDRRRVQHNTSTVSITNTGVIDLHNTEFQDRMVSKSLHKLYYVLYYVLYVQLSYNRVKPQKISIGVPFRYQGHAVSDI